MEKKLYRSKRDRMLAGICGGLGEYFQIDATLIRLLWVILSLSGSGILIYLAAMVIVPENPAEPRY